MRSVLGVTISTGISSPALGRWSSLFVRTPTASTIQHKAATHWTSRRKGNPSALSSPLHSWETQLCTSVHWMMTLWEDSCRELHKNPQSLFETSAARGPEVETHYVWQDVEGLWQHSCWGGGRTPCLWRHFSRFIECVQSYHSPEHSNPWPLDLKLDMQNLREIMEENVKNFPFGH